MKRTQAGTWRRFTAVLASVALVLGMNPSAAFATGAEAEGVSGGTVKYVSLGDSMVNGYGLDGYEYEYHSDDSTCEECTDLKCTKGHAVFHWGNGYLQVAPDAYPAQLAERYGWDLTQLAVSAMRAEDLHWVLEYDPSDASQKAAANMENWDEDTWNEAFSNGDYFTWDEFSTGRFTKVYPGSTPEAVAKTYQDSVAQADVISLGIGNGNFGVFMLGRIMEAIGFDKSSTVDKYSVESAIRNLDEDAQAAILEAVDVLRDELGRYGISVNSEGIEKDLFDTLSYAVASYLVNYRGVLDEIVDLNPDAEIIIVGLMNTMNGMQLSVGDDVYDMGDVMGATLGVVSDYMAALPAVLQACGEYPDATFYYAEAADVDVLMNNYGDEIKKGNVTVRDRFITEVKDMAWPLLGDMVSKMETGAKLVEITADEVATYEKLSDIQKVQYASEDKGRAISIALYLAFEDAIVESAENATLSVEAIASLGSLDASLFNGVAAHFQNNIGTAVQEKLTGLGSDASSMSEEQKASAGLLLALPETMSKALQSDDDIFGLLNCFARCLIGNGLGAHPSAAGHDALTEAIAESYGSGYTAADKTVDNLKAACEALGNLVAEYYDEAYAYAYQYAVEQGYVDQALASIDEVIAALEAVDLESLEGTDAFKAELAAAVEKAVDALDAAKALIAAADELDADSLDALVAALAEADEAVGQALDALEQAGADADALVASALEQVRAELTSEVIPQIEADLGAALDEAYAYISGKASEAVQRFAELVKETVTDYAPEAADWIYNWLLENPDCVIAFVAEHGSDAADFIGRYADDAAQVLGWIYENYGEDIAGFLIDNHAEIFENMAKLVSEHGQNAWNLIEAYLDALDVSSSAESLYAQIIGSLNEDWEGVLAELEKALSGLEIALNDAIDAILGELEDASAEFEAEAAAKIQIELDRIQAEADRIMADIDAMIEAGAPSADEIEVALNELDGLLSDLEELAEQLPAEAEAAAKAAVSEIQGEIDALLAKVEAELAQAVYDATHGEYVVTEGSSYVALGDAAAAGEGSYAGKLFAHMKGLASEAGFDLPDDRFADLAAEGLTSSAMLAALEAGEWDEELAGAGLVTVGVGYEELTSSAAAKAITVLENYLGCAMTGSAYESADATDWSAYVGADAAAALDRAVDAVRAELADELGDESAAAMAGDIAEAYAFSYCGFAARCADVLDAVRDRAPGAEVVLVGLGNPLEGLTLSLGGRDLEVGRYAGYVAAAANAQLLAYAALGGDGVTFVDVSGAGSDAGAELAELAGMLASFDLDALRGGEGSGQSGLLSGVLAKLDALGSAAAWMPNADGQEHVFGRILDAVEITAGAPGASQPSLARIAGDYAKDTSALISAEAFGDGGCGAVVVARDDDFRDAMSAAGLAGALGCPVLLTSRDGLSDVAAAEVERLGAETAYVIGGPVALSESVDSALGDMGLGVERVWGEQSYDTSVECARLIAGLGGSEDGAAVVAYGQNFQDALSMSSFAYRYKVPIFLQTFGDTSEERGLTDEAVELINGSFDGALYVAGGEGAVSSASLEAVGFDEESGDVRLGGWDGYETSAVIAGYMVETGLLDAETVAVCCGAVEANGLDALSGSALVGGRRGVLLLASGQPDYGAEHVSDMLGFLSDHAGAVSSAYVLGGAYVMPSSVYDAVADVWGLPHEAA